MLLTENEVRRIMSRFQPDYIACFIPKFDEVEPQLYDYLQSGAKPGTLDDSNMKPRANSFMITMDRGPERLDKSKPSFDIPIWPPIEGGSRTDNCGLASNTYQPKEILEKAIAHSGYNLIFEVVHPDDLAARGSNPTSHVKDTATLTALMGDDSQAAIVKTAVPNFSSQRQEAKEQTQAELRRIDELEAQKKADDEAESRARMAQAKAEAPPRETAIDRANAKRRETRAAKAAIAKQAQTLPA